MDYLIVIMLLVFGVWTYIIFLAPKKLRLPPGPNPYPIVGNIFKLGDKPHHSLASLSKAYGPLMTLKLGSITTIIVSSPKTARDVLQKYDHLLSHRQSPEAVHAHDHSKFSMVWTSSVQHFRNVRKICASQMFTVQRLDASRGLRQKKVKELLDLAHESCNSGQAVDIGRAGFTTSLNLISNTFFSIDMANYHSSASQEFKASVWGVMEEIGRPNVADYFPVLKFADPQGVRRRMTIYIKKIFGFFDGIFTQRSQLRAPTSASNDVLDALLNLTQENDSQLRVKDIKHLFLDLFLAGTDTTSSTLEWAMAELLRNPTALAKVRKELEEIIGKDRAVEESDIANLPYLQAVIKEILRLHPPAPLLLPRRAEADVEIDGFIVPKDAQILVNVWAIARDPSIWSNPDSFVPERFLESKIDVKGRDFELLPFGAGRRICPGLPLGHRMVHLMLASLLHSFDWKLENGMEPEDMDMSDKFGITLGKAKPLRVIPIKL